VALSASVLTPQLSAWKLSIDHRLSQICQGGDPLQKTMQALLESGTRIRPLLFLALVEGFGGQASSVLEISCALEMTYLYGVSHFSLPCQLSGANPSKPPAYQKWGEALCLLAGDALLAQAVEIVAHQEHIPYPARVQLILKLARAVGVEGMVGGQASSLECQVGECSSQALWEMHRRKTGALMRCCFEAAACVSHAGHVVAKRLGQTGEELGIALQLLDDLFHEEGLLGMRATMTDRRSSTIRTLGIALSRSQALQIIQHAKQRVREDLRHPEPALYLLERLSHRMAESQEGGVERTGR
jgi:geranylgeranyl pyrophosphate synthase